MKKIFTGKDWAKADAHVIERDRISIHDLVDRVAQKFCMEMKYISSLPQGIVYVFAGPGNNGADGLSIARRLLQDGRRVHCYLFKGANELSEACAQQVERLSQFKAESLTIVSTQSGEQFELPILDQHTIVIDALFGTGLNRPLEGGFAGIVQFINASSATIISVDIPSGLYDEYNGENNLEGIITADYTFTCEAPKVSFLLADNEPYVGTIRTLALDLGYDGDEALSSEYALFHEADMVRLLHRPSRFAHKGTMGHALILAGSESMAGSAMLSASGALRSGVGKVTLHLPSALVPIAQTVVPEVIIDKDPESALITTLPKDIHRYSAIAVGPGIGTAPITAQLFENLFRNIQSPLVLDADALNILAMRLELLSLIPQNSILTPHPGELDRLVGHSVDEYGRLTKARELAMEQQLIVILKGAYTATCLPDGMVIFNTSGNAGLATAGTGDVLTGIIVSLLAQGYPPTEAAPMAVYLHGLAADIYASKNAPLGMIARDVAEYLPLAIRQIQSRS